MAATPADELETTAGRVALPPWAFLETLPTVLQASTDPVAGFREALASAMRACASASRTTNRSKRWCATARAWSTSCCAGPGPCTRGGERDVALIAVGGYGRGELHPCSDIDVLILLPKSEVAGDHEGIERFLAFLWDIGLEVGHSVRTIDDCQRESAADVSVATTLIEARLLAGPDYLFQAMRRALAQDSVWSSRAFFEAKVAEQQARHHRHHDTAYNLEPNVKTSPGGLRDIQTIAGSRSGTSAPRRSTSSSSTASSPRRTAQAAHGTGLPVEVRFALHVITGRREDRLLFDHQIRLARMFGYEDATYTLAVEQFMQRYYRTAMDVSLLNEMLLQLFRERC